MKFKYKLFLVLFATVQMLSMQANANQMELILADNKYIDLKISPDGNHFAMRFYDKEKIKLSIFDISTSKIKAISGIGLGGELSVGPFRWANNNRIVYRALISEGWYNEFKTTGEMFGMDIDGSHHEVIYGYRADNSNLRQQSATRIKQKKATLGYYKIIDMLTNDEDNIIIKSTPYEDKTSAPTVYKLNINSGEIKKIAGLPLPRANAVVSAAGKLSYAYGVNKKGHGVLFKRENNTWQKIMEYDGSEGGATPVSVIGNTVYMRDNSDNDIEGLYKINLSDNSKELISRHDFTDISAIYINPVTKQPYLIVNDPDKESFTYLKESANLQLTHKKLRKAFKGYQVYIVSMTQDLNKIIVRASSDRVPGDYYLFDRATQNATFLASQKPQLKPQSLAKMQAISYKNRKGTTIHGYFTKALGVAEGQTAPMVVMPHGGPHGPRDYWGFDSQVQVFASNGISVLQINYTGSGGYGKKFEYDGYKHWGDLIQNDITDGTRWAIDNGMVNKDQVCIYGFSFGGYAALMGVIKEPDLYQCAAAGGGVYELELMYRADDINDLLWGKEYLKSAIGNDKEVLKQNSPVYHTDKIKVPVFIEHGKNDSRVPIKQAKLLVKALKDSGVKYKTMFLSKEGHGFASLENRVKFNTALIKFLKSNLSK
jgi:dipeptidyl aminopeptidase/acylaminoacyl peptidase